MHQAAGTQAQKALRFLTKEVTVPSVAGFGGSTLARG